MSTLSDDSATFVDVLDHSNEWSGSRVDSDTGGAMVCDSGRTTDPSGGTIGAGTSKAGGEDWQRFMPYQFLQIDSDEDRAIPSFVRIGVASWSG